MHHFLGFSQLNAEPVVIIGAGLAGLCCARRLVSRQVPCIVLEASDSVGGRIRTDSLDGFLMDRGFQVLQTAYVCVPSNVAASYAPKDQSLICASIRNGYFEIKDLENQVLGQLRNWFGSEVSSWQLLRRYDIRRAVPFQAPDKVIGTFKLSDSLFLCGDYLTTASINGAMSSGIQTAEAILRTLPR